MVIYKNIFFYIMSVIYLDNNGTTMLCTDKEKRRVIKWMECRANPSSDSILSKGVKKMIEDSKNIYQTI